VSRTLLCAPLALLPAAAAGQGLPPAPNLLPLIVPGEGATCDATETRLSLVIKETALRLRNPNHPELLKLRDKIDQARRLRKRLEGRLR
jgi:hypothetical protein